MDYCGIVNCWCTAAGLLCTPLTVRVPGLLWIMKYRENRHNYSNTLIVLFSMYTSETLGMGGELNQPQGWEIHVLLILWNKSYPILETRTQALKIELRLATYPIIIHTVMLSLFPVQATVALPPPLRASINRKIPLWFHCITVCIIHL
jgi:hypothetical protein